MHLAHFSIFGLINIYSLVDDGEPCRHFLLNVIGTGTSPQVAVVWISFTVGTISTVDDNIVLSVFRKIFGAGRHSAFDLAAAVCNTLLDIARY
jgi:hypothetical protein